MRKNLTRAAAAALAAGCLLCGGLSASAVTVDEVAQKAREVGFPEEQVQLGYNYWATGEYTQADLELAYAELCKYDAQANDKIDSIFDTGSSTTPPATEPEKTGSDSAVQPTGSAGTSGNTSGGASSNASGNSSAGTGNSANSVSSADFINMTLDEKIAYVNSMSAADKENFLNNLSPSERNSIIKQMNVNDQAELLQGYIDAAKGMNMNIAVDSISADGIAITVRDDNGTIIDKSATGITIDETGISYDGLLAGSAIAVLVAAAGFAGLYSYMRRTDGQAQ